jgi:hypothetical protein
LLNFGNEPQIKRRVFNNEFKDRIKHWLKINHAFSW